MAVLWSFLFVGGRPYGHLVVAYPLIPWLSIMMAGFVLGRFLIETRGRAHSAHTRSFALIGLALLALFALVRGVDGYGNWGLYRDSLLPLQWLHVAKYPPSLSYTALELGLTFLLLALFFRLEDTRRSSLLQPFLIFGSTAFFYYLLHVHLLALFELVFRLDRSSGGLVKTYAAALAVLLALYPLCTRYRRYKAARPDGWTRYI
jgi:uncharacterized membrane protein